MAGTSDKARFYLERSVPELQDLLQKKIFTKVRYAVPEFCVYAEKVISQRLRLLRKSDPILNMFSMPEAHILQTMLDTQNMR